MKLINLYICVNFILLIFISNLSAEKLIKFGCYKYSAISGFITVNKNFNKTISACISACETHQKRFAGIYNKVNCICGNYLNGTATDQNLCDNFCLNDQSNQCKDNVHIYETFLGAPSDLKLIESFENALHISWNAPFQLGFSELKGYKVNAKPLIYFSEQTQPVEKHYKFSDTKKPGYLDPKHTSMNLYQNQILDGLYPGVKYRIEVSAFFDRGNGYPAFIEAWTKVGKPSQPMTPEIDSYTDTTINVHLEEVVSTGGPISIYHIVVVDETIAVEIDFTYLQDYYNASEQNLPYYIAAELTPENFLTEFTVGDGKYYGKYFNKPLKPNRDYHILLGVLSTINETKSSYSQSSHSQHEDYSQRSNHFHKKSQLEEEVENKTRPNNALILGLSIAIGLFAFLLVASVIIFFALRVYFKRNSRLSGENEELAVHAHYPHQDFENGYALGLNYIDDDESHPDHYRLLRERVTIIPHQNINIVGDIGIGKFGDIKKGVAQNSNFEQVNSLIHRIQDDALSPIQKSEMLKDFDMHIRLGKNENIVCLIGLLEELNIISIVFEYETLTMKTNLVESRAIQHYPVYAEKNRRFSTLQESHVLSILAGIARGMKHMHSMNIPHGRLSARNIALRDGIHPKITGFGLIHFHNDLYIPDYRRWQAPEILQGKTHSSCKSDLWSFGCLMWEAVTLGGTPHADIRIEELCPRIVRGLRLVQPQYVSDELYQSMLLCWQNDCEERPPFDELELMLERLAVDKITPHLLFSLYSSFNYEPYSSHLEYVD